jgi:Mrp family chromosome partitioning ATPase
VSVVAPHELLHSSKLEARMAETRQRYNYVVIDTPPFVPFPDCRLIGAGDGHGKTRPWRRKGEGS